MATATLATTSETVADLLARLGDIPPHRVRMKPTPGTATEQDVIDAWNRDRRLCELIEGTLVEKTVGFPEGILAAILVRILGVFVHEHDLGLVNGPDGMMRIAPHMVRMPDVSFISWERLGSKLIPRTAIPDLYPNLAVEVISEGNSHAEMQRKLHEYFDAGVSLVWYIYPGTETAIVYTSPEQSTNIPGDGELDGGAVLPGFSLKLADLFRNLAPRQ